MYTHAHIPVAANFVQNIAAATGNTSYVNTYIYTYTYVLIQMHTHTNMYVHEIMYQYICTRIHT